MAETKTTATTDPRRAAIIKGFRASFPGAYDSLPDDEIYTRLYKKHYSHLDPDDYDARMQKKYAPDWKEETPSIGQTLREFPGQMVKSVAQSLAAAPAAMGKAAALVTTPQPELADVRFEDLVARGYKPEVAENIMRQRIQTQSEMSENQAAEAQTGLEQSAEGIAVAGSAGVTGPLSAALTPAKSAAGAVIKRGAPWLIRHIATGSTGVGSYEGIKSAVEGKTASEIFDDIVHGGAIGAVAGPVLAGVGTGIAKSIGALFAIPSNISATAAAKVLQARLNGMNEFANKLQPNWFASRFADLPSLADESIPANQAAGELLMRMYGDEASNFPTDAFQKIVSKIAQFRNLNRIDPSLRDVPAFPTGAAMGTNPALPNQQMAGAIPNIAEQRMGMPGGPAPEPMPGSLQAQPGGFKPPTNIEMMEGVEGGPPQVKQLQPQMQMEGIEPTGMQPSPIFTGEAPSVGSGPAALQSPLGAVAGPSLEPKTVPMAVEQFPKASLPNEMSIGQPTVPTKPMGGMIEPRNLKLPTEAEQKALEASSKVPPPPTTFKELLAQATAKLAAIPDNEKGFVKADMLGLQKVRKLAGAKRTTGKITAALSDIGTYVSPTVLKRQAPASESFWLTPEGDLIKVDDHINSSMAAIEKLKLKSPVPYKGLGMVTESVQTLLNHGFVRLGVYRKGLGIDVTAPLSANQERVLKELNSGEEKFNDIFVTFYRPNGNPHGNERSINAFVDASRALHGGK